MKYLITGGTGTLGKALVERLHLDNEVIVFSRDEFKQQQLRKQYPHIRTIIGDVRNYFGLKMALRGVDVCIHTAALKHIDVIEDNSYEGVQVNVMGTQKVINAAEANNIKHVIFCTTDKAVKPINVYGMTKGIAEKMILSRNNQSSTQFSSFRWGNVIGSRGSALDGFIKSLKNERRVYVTSTEMTRFWIKIEDAVQFVLFNYKNAPKDEVLVPSMKACPVILFVRAIATVLGISTYEIVETGVRRGEKIHEDISSAINSKNAPQYSFEEMVELVRLPVLEAQ